MQVPNFFFWNLVFCNQTRALLQASTSDGSFCRALGAKKVKSQVAVSCSSARVFFSPFACGAMDPAQEHHQSSCAKQQTAWWVPDESIQTSSLCSSLCYCLNSLVPVPHGRAAGVHVFLSLHLMRLHDHLQPYAVHITCKKRRINFKTCSGRVHNFGQNFADYSWSWIGRM